MTITVKHEKKLLEVLRALPPQRVNQVLDFARWLQTQPLEEEDLAELEAEDAAWEASYLENQETFRAMAQKALAEAEGGATLDMVIEAGRIRPQ